MRDDGALVGIAVWNEVGATKISFHSFREQHVRDRDITSDEKGSFPYLSQIS
jgi:hypothetical protein